jgi:hypothetical protein
LLLLEVAVALRLMVEVVAQEDIAPAQAHQVAERRLKVY